MIHPTSYIPSQLPWVLFLSADTPKKNGREYRGTVERRNRYGIMKKKKKREL
jgi:hypothetical protein